MLFLNFPEVFACSVELKYSIRNNEGSNDRIVSSCSDVMFNYSQSEGLVEYHPNRNHQSAIECSISGALCLEPPDYYPYSLLIVFFGLNKVIKSALENFIILRFFVLFFHSTKFKIKLSFAPLPMRYYLIITIRIFDNWEWYWLIIPCLGPINYLTASLTFCLGFELVPEPYVHRDAVRESEFIVIRVIKVWSI